MVVTNFKVDSIEAKSSRLGKDLTEAMDQATKAKEKVKELKDVLKVEKMLVVQKDKEIQVVLLKTDEECEKVITKFLEFYHFFDLQFVQYFVLIDKTKEKEGEVVVVVVVESDGATRVGLMDEGHVEEVIATP